MIYENKFIISTKLPIDRLWSVLSDTSRMNKTMGLPPWAESQLAGSRVVKTKVFGLMQEWVEAPWTWIINKTIHQERTYTRGIMKKQTGVFRILDDKNDLRQVEIMFRWYGNFFLKYFIGPFSGEFIKRRMMEYVKFQEDIYFQNLHAKSDIKIPLTPLRELNADDHHFVEKIIKETQFDDSKSMALILNHLLTADSLDINRLNPKQMAIVTKLSLIQVIEILTVLTHHGYLAITWDVICPHCRGPQTESEKLRYISAKTSCLTCDIDFTTESETSIEVSFKPQNKLRKIDTVVYCAAEPAKKAHILVNWLVNSNQSLDTELQLNNGSYRIRCLKSKRTTEIRVADNLPVLNEIKIDFRESQINFRSGKIRFVFFQNQDNDYITIESLAWSDEKYLAREALNNTHVRSLLSDDLLKVGVKLDIGEQIIYFTDIVGSTPLYRAFGDAKAFVTVQNHYTVIENIIKKHAGIVVKFIGDAVMGSFSNASDAINANQEIHQSFQDPSNIVLRSSFHIGKVLCVNMNVGLDYFGQTVNTAAKLQKWAQGSETAISDEMLNRLSEKDRANLKIKLTQRDENIKQTVHIYRN